MVNEGSLKSWYWNIHQKKKRKPQKKSNNKQIKNDIFVECQCVISSNRSGCWIAAIWTFFFFPPRFHHSAEQKAWMLRFRMLKWWSAADLHYSNTLTTGVCNRMCLLAAFVCCLRVVRKWEQQHPGDQRPAAVVAVLVVAVVEVVGRHCLCGPSKKLQVPQAWKYHTAAPGDRNGVVVIMFFFNLFPMFCCSVVATDTWKAAWNRV